MKTSRLLLIGLACSITFASCKKDKEEETSLFDDTLFSQESTTAGAEKALSDDVEGLTLKSGSMDCNFSIGGTCAVVTESSETFPKTITINYGSGCADFQGRTKTGKVFIHLTDTFINEGAVRTVTFENFAINGVGIAGERVTTNNGLNSSDQMEFTRVINTTITYNNASFDRDFVENITWVSGFNNEICGDNIVSITGEGSVTRPSGVVIPRTITSPLIYDQACGQIKAGRIEIYSLQGQWIIDYGDGTCDNEFTVTRPNGVVITHTF